MARGIDPGQVAARLGGYLRVGAAVGRYGRWIHGATSRGLTGVSSREPSRRGSVGHWRRVPVGPRARALVEVAGVVGIAWLVLETVAFAVLWTTRAAGVLVAPEPGVAGATVRVAIDAAPYLAVAVLAAAYLRVRGDAAGLGASYNVTRPTSAGLADVAAAVAVSLLALAATLGATALLGVRLSGPTVVAVTWGRAPTAATLVWLVGAVTPTLVLVCHRLVQDRLADAVGAPTRVVVAGLVFTAALTTVFTPSHAVMFGAFGLLAGGLYDRRENLAVPMLAFAAAILVVAAPAVLLG